MLDAVGVGGYGGTNWSSASVIEMWLAVGNQQTTPHWELLAGWRKSYELTERHTAAVKKYRENLAAAWPPEKSAASAAYIERLDDLVEHLQHTYDAAVANYGAFCGATLALSSARDDLEKVVNEYLANQNKLAAFEKEQANSRSSGGLMRRQAPSPPVTEERQTQLESRARRIMFGLSIEIIQARLQITQPPKYAPGMGVDANTKDYSGNTFSPPPVPPIVPVAHGSNWSIDTAGLAQEPAPNHDIQRSKAITSAPRPPDLVLEGTDVTAPSSQTLTPAHSPIIGESQRPPTFIAGAFNTIPVGANSSRFSSSGARDISATPGHVLRPSPPNGTIGSTPTKGLGVTDLGYRPMSSVHPVGGILNPNSPVGPRTQNGRGRQSTTHQFGTIRGPGAEGNDDRPISNLWRLDNPWKTAKGVDAVVRPRLEQRVDPGPAIGLT